MVGVQQTAIGLLTIQVRYPFHTPTRARSPCCTADGRFGAITGHTRQTLDRRQNANSVEKVLSDHHFGLNGMLLRVAADDGRVAPGSE